MREDSGKLEKNLNLLFLLIQFFASPLSTADMMCDVMCDVMCDDPPRKVVQMYSEIWLPDFDSEK